MKRQRVVKESPEKWSEKEDATENTKMKGKNDVRREPIRRNPSTNPLIWYPGRSKCKTLEMHFFPCLVLLFFAEFKSTA